MKGRKYEAGRNYKKSIERPRCNNVIFFLHLSATLASLEKSDSHGCIVDIFLPKILEVWLKTEKI